MTRPTLVWSVLLGPIFAAQGWTSSPFNIYPTKGDRLEQALAWTAGE